MSDIEKDLNNAEEPEENEDQEVEDEEESSSDDESDDSDQDYKALYEAEKARAEKLDLDRRAALGSQRSQRERDEVLWGLQDQLDAMKKSNTALLRALSSGETDGLVDELKTIENEGAQSQASRQFESRYASLYESFEEAIKDENGNQLLDFSSDELQPFVEKWVAAHKNKDLVELTGYLAEVQAMARKVERTRAKSKPAVEPKPKKKRKNQDLGPASGAVNPNPNLKGVALISNGLKERGGLKGLAT